MNEFHTHDFNNTAGQCACGERMPLPPYEGTAGQIVLAPFQMTLPYPQTETLPNEATQPLPLVNMGSPVGPGFVVYERKRGEYGYDRKMALASVGLGWSHLVAALFDTIDHDKKYNPKSGFANMIVTQVKEKFGQLRIYFMINVQECTESGRPVGPKVTLRDGAYDEVQGFVEALVIVSGKTCESCGRQALPPDKRRKRSWILSLCGECDKLDTPDLRSLIERTEQTE